MDQAANDSVKFINTCIQFLFYGDKNAELNRSKVNRAGAEKYCMVLFPQFAPLVP